MKGCKRGWMRRVLMMGIAAFFHLTSWAQELKEETEILIKCRLADDAAKSSPFLRANPWLEPKPGEYSYRLWLPAGYLANTTRRWPCIFIASPGGNAKLGEMRDWIQRHKFIAILLVESRNGPWGPIVGNFLAAHDDAVQRVRIQEGLKWATGLSGGARAASIFAQCRPGFSAVILQAAGCAYGSNGDYIVDNIRSDKILLAMCMGRNDKNRTEAETVRARVGERLFRVFEFDGGHNWAPAAVFAQAADWAWKMTCEEGPTNPALREYYQQMLLEKLQQARSQTDPWPRYLAFSDALDLARSRSIAQDPKVSAELQAATAELNRLRGHPDVTRQAQAREALARLRQSASKMPQTMFRMQLQTFLQQYQGTTAAEEAQKLLAELPEDTKPRPRR